MARSRTRQGYTNRQAAHHEKSPERGYLLRRSSAAWAKYADAVSRTSFVFYFVTTGATLGGRSQTARLYKLTFDNAANPTGGTIQLVVDAANLTGTDGERARSFDNITVDGQGRVLVQEDPGNSRAVVRRGAPLLPG